ncbi:hypothetical protein PV10_08678 [Exophiala mesophila]|uniref:PD-(D/E)XK nuclease-like domain-containing protein n=1 Tax=Exophiala mesophila TaxID=212818 RepID=A0A0D1Z2T7_EXOME|nr:uncharacterized protein PV10_08678 [Exophiala mesophila]KIV89067.1 hypothetical protein PV10_08678 [Exophiala mesophila]
MEFEGPLSIPEDESKSESESENESENENANANANAGNDSGTTSSRKTRDVYPYSTRNRNRNRMLFTLLAVSNPRIRFLQPGNSVIPPEHVSAIWRTLSAGSGLHFIPRAFESLLHIHDPNGFENIQPHMFDESAAVWNDELSQVWNHVHGIYKQAERCHNYHKNKEAWVQLVRHMLTLSGVGWLNGMVEINSVQSQAVCRDLLSTLPDNVFPLARKVDLALAFNPSHPDIKGPWDDLHLKHEGVRLSHIDDAYTGTLVVGCGINVKEPGGDYDEAIMQLGVWSAAALELLLVLASSEARKKLYPYLGITVIGHEWRLHLSWKIVGSDDKLVVGPFPLFSLSTVSYTGIFALRQLLSRVHSYLCLDYWPWYKSAVLLPLSAVPFNELEGYCYRT